MRQESDDIFPISERKNLLPKNRKSETAYQNSE